MGGGRRPHVVVVWAWGSVICVTSGLAFAWPGAQARMGGDESNSTSGKRADVDPADREPPVPAARLDQRREEGAG